jgi:hypothetical protein
MAAYNDMSDVLRIANEQFKIHQYYSKVIKLSWWPQYGYGYGGPYADDQTPIGIYPPYMYPVDATWSGPNYLSKEDYWRYLYDKHDSVTQHFFRSVSICNILDQMIEPKRRVYDGVHRDVYKRYSTSQYVAQNTYPREYEMMPYIAVQPYKKPLFTPIPPKPQVGSKEAAVRIKAEPRVPKRADGMPVWWKGIPPEPDYQGALDALGKFGEEKFEDINDAWKDVQDWKIGDAIDKLTDQHLNE